MGACTFVDTLPRLKGVTLRTQFTNLVSDAIAEAEYDAAMNGERYEGYSGTIAEKHDFRVIALMEGKNAQETVEVYEKLSLTFDQDQNNPFNDKWGPAGCVFDETQVIFFGIASS